MSSLLQADRAAQSRRHVTAAWLILPLLLGGAVALLFNAGSAHSHHYWRRSSDGGSRSPLQTYLAKEAQQAANATNAAQNNDGNALLGQAPCSPATAPKPPDSEHSPFTELCRLPYHSMPYCVYAHALPLYALSCAISPPWWMRHLSARAVSARACVRGTHQ